jgi:Peptidase family M23
MAFRSLLLTLIILFSLYLQAQPPSYPQNYFRNPLGIPMQLSANFGELRPNHWHMGLDIRTDQKENLPVYAAADGYIAHIGIRPASFGRFIIINHPNGLSTLYGHLNDFFPELEKYVRDQQYKQESWATELDFSKDQFPVHKGNFIAFSGNTGGSQGPHLHFEIFDTKTEKRLNPLLFGMPVQDAVPPTLLRLAIYDRGKSLNEQSPILFSLKNTDNGYIIPKMPVLQTGLNKISFAIQANDKTTGGGSPNGIYSAELFMDDQPQLIFVLDSISYDETVYINAQIDYKYDYGGGAYLQHLSVMPGDHGTVYKQINGNGVIMLNDTTIHAISIEVKDAHGNSSLLNFALQYKDSLARPEAYRVETKSFAPNSANQLIKPGFELFMPANSLYDTMQPLYYRTNTSAIYAVSASHKVNDESIPLHDDVTVRIKPDKTIPEEWKDKILIQRTGKTSNTRKARWEGEWLVAKFNDLGSFQAFADYVPPVFNDLGKGDTVDLSPAGWILFTPRDNFGIIKKFRVEMDSNWIRFTNDKGRNWIYKFDENFPYGVHEMKVTAEDLAGNITTKSWWFKKYPYTPPKKKAKLKKKSAGKIKKPSKKK